MSGLLCVDSFSFLLAQIMMCSAETPKFHEISSEQPIPSKEGARACVEALPESEHRRLKLSISPVSSVSGSTLFYPIYLSSF